jgi:hypothetical protein
MIRNQRHKLLFIIESNTLRLEKILSYMEEKRIPIINLNLVLADQMRRIPPNERPFEVNRILRAHLEGIEAEIVCFCHIEYLFDPELKQDPIRLFESLSGNRVLIIIWPGEVKEGTLRYASPEHVEFYQNSEYAHAIYPMERED